MKHRRSIVGVVLSALVIAAALAVPPAPSAAVTQAAAAKRLLLLTHNTFYNHSSLADIERVVPEWGKTAGFSVTSLAGYKQTVRCTIAAPCPPDVVDLSMIDAEYLSQFDGIMASTNGELPFTGEGKQALVDFVNNGKGIVFIHQSMVTMYTFKPWGEMLGAYMGRDPLFDGRNANKRPAVMRIEDRDHPATRNLPEGWTLHDEFYQFATTEGVSGPTGHPVPVAFSRDRVKVLISVDSEKTDFSGIAGWKRGGDYPQSWYQHYGKGRTFYTALGHRADLWTGDATYRAHVVGAIRWALGLED